VRRLQGLTDAVAICTIAAVLLLLPQVVPYTLAENAGLNPIQMVTELRAMHGKGVSGAGINVRRYCHHYYHYCY
jgi:hypothetical protein